MSWKIPYDKFGIVCGEVHVWKIKFSEWLEDAEDLSSLLSSDELQRAGRFHFVHDQQRYIIRHSLLRKILSEYLKIPPGQIVFQYNQFGKPILPGTSFNFNLSHSRDLLLIAVTHDAAVGVDVEYLNDDAASQDMIEKFFSQQEADSIARLSPEVQDLAFYLCWTRKEAFIKAKGEGLNYPLHQFVVSVDPEVPAQLLQTKREPDEATRWMLFNLETEKNYAAALAVNWAPELRGSTPHTRYSVIDLPSAKTQA